jgi:tetratricopeptide (TPR) repeat protein
VFYEYLAEEPSSSIWFDAGHLGDAYIRLGQIYGDEGNLEKAEEYYRRFLELWDQASPSVRDRVTTVEAALERLKSGPPIAD